ncbi:MAG: threonylcarbamoyl-AMP synthase [Gemmatimonadetes bacterium]|nr:threonylcarbamoyl-AMP synthase [Gemmatimonadota bacterium]
MRVVDPASPAGPALDEAAALIRAGGLVAFPTETVYGLGANALDAAAVQAIYAAKGRPPTNPVIVHVHDAHEARALVRQWPDVAATCAQAWWPGPLTLVLPRESGVPDVVTAGLDAVAVRVPSHPVARALIAAAERPIAAPSANRSNQLSPTTAAHVAQGLGRRVGLILDGGPCAVGLESTVLDLTGPVPTVLRPGGVTLDALRAVLGAVRVREARVHDAEARVSPGMMARHYAPRARVVLVRGPLMPPDAARWGALVVGAEAPGAAHVERMPADPAGYGRALYAALHAVDDAGCTVVLVELPGDGEAWRAVRDRLARAATPA